MQERQGVQDRQQHLDRLVLRQCAMFQQLREGLVGVLHQEIQVRLSIELAATRLQEAEQLRVLEARGQFPLLAV
jgi:hypothetical protein